MSFVPPRCPNVDCPRHRDPSPKFCKRIGTYRVLCRPDPIQRFLCLTCRRSFSRQTFRVDYCDHRPHVNAQVFALLTSGVGFRQTSRVVHMSHGCVLRKAMKLGRMLGDLHRNLMGRLPEGRTYVLDEEETFESSPLRPLTVPLLEERKTKFLVAATVAPIRRLARRGSRRRRRQEAYERRHGRRPDRSRDAVRSVLEILRQAVGQGAVHLLSDLKSCYPTVARSVFGDDLRSHQQVSSRLPRDFLNPLFGINLAIAMARDNVGRLRRQSWLVSKLGDRLKLHLNQYIVYRNYVRKRFNRDQPHETPAVLLGLLPRQLDREEVVMWRQDWGELSCHPLSRSGHTTVANRDAVASAAGATTGPD